MELKNVRINVTQKDINKGCKTVAQSCPIALSINRRLKSEFYCSVYHIVEIYSHSSKMKYGGAVPERLTRWAESFDGGETMKPTTFVISLPDWCLK